MKNKALHRFAIVLAALAGEAIVVFAGDWKLAAGVILVPSIFVALKAVGSIDALDLFDRSTLYFGLIPGLALGFDFARRVDGGVSWRTGAAQTLLSVPSLVFFTALAVSFWARRVLIRRTLRKGFI